MTKPYSGNGKPFVLALFAEKDREKREAEADRMLDLLQIRHLASLLKPGGTLTVAHGMSREKIDAHHHGAASHVSNGLMPAANLAEIFSKYMTVISVVSDEKMYQVTGERENRLDET